MSIKKDTNVIKQNFHHTVDLVIGCCVLGESSRGVDDGDGGEEYLLCMLILMAIIILVEEQYLFLLLIVYWWRRRIFCMLSLEDT